MRQHMNQKNRILILRKYRILIKNIRAFFKQGMDRDVVDLGQREFVLIMDETIFKPDELRKRFQKTPEKWAEFKSDATRVFKINEGNGIDRANCYGYAMNDMDPMVTVGSQHPGDRALGVNRVSDAELNNLPTIKHIRAASPKEIDAMIGQVEDETSNPGLKHLVNNIESEGGKWEGADYPKEIDDGQYRIAVYASNVTGDYHFLRENSDGTFSHKTGPGEPVTNMSVYGEIIDSPDDMTGPNLGGYASYALLGYMSVSNGVDVGYRNDRDLSDIHTKDEAEFLIGLRDFPEGRHGEHVWNRPEERDPNGVSPYSNLNQ